MLADKLNSDGELLPQFRSFKDLYNSKIQQQQSLSQELRKHQNALRQGAPQDTAQRTIFENLRRLLEQKAAVCKLGAQGAGGPGGAMGRGGRGRGVGRGDKLATFDAYGGTNIMTLNDQLSP